MQLLSAQSTKLTVPLQPEPLATIGSVPHDEGLDHVKGPFHGLPPNATEHKIATKIVLQNRNFQQKIQIFVKNRIFCQRSHFFV